jgi:uncharacterized protein
MTAQPSISVRGEAVLEVDPEIAVVSVTVMARDADRHRALDLLAKRNGNVLAVVRELGEAVEKMESGSASVHPEFKDGNRAKERVTRYVARSSLSVTVRDFTVLGDLVASLAGEEMVAVAGPWWSLRPDSPVHGQARLRAARDASQRARQYAEAFGGRVNGLLEVADAGLLSEGERPVHVRAMAAGGARAFAAAAQSAELEFEPAKQTVHAQVEARFTMTSPDFSQ